jgi:hypothetical protein
LEIVIVRNIVVKTGDSFDKYKANPMENMLVATLASRAIRERNQDHGDTAVSSVAQ